jgi:vacuolar-type H+-ATPase subunit I/STV1
MKPEHAAQVQLVLKQKDETITQLTTDLETAQEVAKSAPVKDQTEEEILKSIKDPAVKAILETQIMKAKAAEEVAKSLKDAQNEKEAIEKAKEVTGLGAEESQLAQVYKSLKAVNPEVCETVFGIFKTASALIAEGGTLSEVGKSAGTEGSAGDENAIWGKIEAAAEEVAKSTNVSKARAISQVISDNPDLYAQYLQAQKG